MIVQIKNNLQGRVKEGIQDNPNNSLLSEENKSRNSKLIVCRQNKRDI